MQKKQLVQDTVWVDAPSMPTLKSQKWVKTVHSLSALSISPTDAACNLKQMSSAAKLWAYCNDAVHFTLLEPKLCIRSLDCLMVKMQIR